MNSHDKQPKIRMSMLHWPDQVTKTMSSGGILEPRPVACMSNVGVDNNKDDMFEGTDSRTTHSLVRIGTPARMRSHLLQRSVMKKLRSNPHAGEMPQTVSAPLGISENFYWSSSKRTAWSFQLERPPSTPRLTCVGFVAIVSHSLRLMCGLRSNPSHIHPLSIY